MKKLEKSIFGNLGLWILIAMVLGIAAGAVLKERVSVIAPLGTLFVSLIKMVVIPLVFFSIINGAAAIGKSHSAGKVGIATFAFYLGTTAFAVVFALILGEVFQPGVAEGLEGFKDMFSDEYVARGDVPGIWETLIGIVPVNPIESLVTGNILQILFFAMFFGFGINSLKEDQKKPLINIIGGVTDALVYIILKVMIIAPIGVFALMADVVGTFGWEVLFSVGKLLAIYTVALIVHTFGFYGLLIKLFSKVSVRNFYAKFAKVQAFALSTASSMATVPLNEETCQEDLGVSKSTTSFVIPLGATINMDGNAIYYALAACFFAQWFGVDLGASEYIAIILTATVGSIGQAGVPGPSLLVVAVLIAANIPVIGLPILFGVDRIFDMMRTAVNVTGDATCAVIVDQLVDKEA
ncbi:Na+/H+-dicarboxylate symporter [Dethiosulfatibacter aminovorans DSM 17477]|uniref:Na+/H+-dicarboxylate symporter n=1 Tax=Dethiosulfatibacter aminovorans DSM 17477 TaxID=1121476 RepID=A0A1M6I9G9_9FIRM|nr:dicarboxylate/amino acid:cation symporter [Dethiosulfatibacter aminovorans]SHJ31097.1 Na+/H+-dicarboxylate symporter [Dethiosulfatibacter aminovorans DSM 17477]